MSKFYTPIPPLVQQSLIAQIFSLISDRPAGVCNFLDAPDLVFPTPSNLRPLSASNAGNGAAPAVKGIGRWKGKDRAEELEDDDTRVIYRHYATLYFV